MTTTQDFDRLSAYLDDQLPARDRAALEARLAAEPELRSSLNDLRLTVRALRALPHVKAPRNFTLTPAQAKGASFSAPRRGPLFPVLRFATAMSALALAVVLVGDLGGGFLAASVRQDATAGGEVEVALAPPTETVEEMAVPAEAPAPSETPAAEMDAMVGEGEAGAADEGTGTLEAAEATIETALVAPEAAVSTTPTGEADRTLAPTAEPSPKTVEPTPTPLIVAEAPPSATEDLFYSADDSAMTSQVAEPPRAGLTPLRLVEVGLIVLTVLLAAAAWVTRRSG